ncbi:uncharacterized protein LOC111325044 [Stylophora pistillata]|uniref:uncharacterized protein LOC111325044 n=1 Tax=Stylophora pistillata TaxID=50429 RepID=UPI000C050CB1|nr:uncharacterized protein LOC111325044 [Stylophora pistillata]
MASNISSADWNKISRLKPKERKEFLKWHLQAREPIRRLSDMKQGDHLLRTYYRGTPIEYAHHFICIGRDEKSRKPKIIHYYNTTWNAIKQMFPTLLGLGSRLEELGIIQEVTLPDGYLIAKSDVDPKTTELLNGVEVERVVWPEELRRYSTEEEIARARRRLGENDFHLMKNNCESFVMWCLCDLNISLQVTSTLKARGETFSAAIRALFQSIKQLPKVAAELWDDFAAATARKAVGNALPKLGISVGAATTVVAETIMAIWDIRKEYKKWRDGLLIKTRKEFIAEVVDRVILGLCRINGIIVGMIVGQIVIPIPVVGGLVGALVGTFGGDLVGKMVSAKTNVKGALAQSIDALIDKFDEINAKRKAHSHKLEQNVENILFLSNMKDGKDTVLFST